MTALFFAHSGLRYLVLLVGVLAALYFALGLGGRRVPGKADRVLMAGYTGLVDLQILLGLLLVATGIFYGALMGHLVMMLLAAGVVHAAAVAARRAGPERRAHGIRLLGVVVSLVLIVGGILAIGRSLVGTGAPSVVS